MTDEMWAAYAESQQKTVVGRQAYWDLGTIACNTIAEIARQKADAEAYRRAWVERQLGA